MLKLLRNIIPERSGLRLLYHKVSAIMAALYYRFPGNDLHIIGVTGTSGKSTTTEIIQYLLRYSGKKCGGLSTVAFHFGGKTIPNTTLRTTLRPWVIQKFLRKMVRRRCQYAVLEVSSHALDQNRVWGTSFDTSVITNIYENEHLDYHVNFSDYLKTKLELFKKLNQGYRKPNIPKTSISNADDEYFELFHEVVADKRWSYSQKQTADIKAENIVLDERGISFSLRLPNASTDIFVPMIGRHNLENILAAITVGISIGIPISKIKSVLSTFSGVPGRLEIMPKMADNQPTVIVDFSYKPSALDSVLQTLKEITKGRLIVVWGGAGGRLPKNWQDCAELLHKYADEIVLTTDDPGNTDPRFIAKKIREKIPRTEGEDFFEIPDRYEAIRYAICTGDADDLVLIAGRGHESLQQIGNKRIDFDDREVAKEILDVQ